MTDYKITDAASAIKRLKGIAWGRHGREGEAQSNLDIMRCCEVLCERIDVLRAVVADVAGFIEEECGYDQEATDGSMLSAASDLSDRLAAAWHDRTVEEPRAISSGVVTRRQ